MVRLRRETTALLLIDVQERLLPVMRGAQELEQRIGIAVEGARALELPLAVTEQYPKGLGHTVATLASRLDGIPPVEKASFSCCGVDGVERWLAEHAPQTLLIAGIETHVCVLQTCRDLLERGITPAVLADCVGARHEHDHLIALERLRDGGATITTLESALFELTGVSGTPLFKQISALVKPL